ncbi:restriction endonuclease subunit S [Lactococcus lactis]|uniref:restriction endonuclease subunit S n=1 Tax=Lactococcus lactis TaxID=1358 RepID=UPI0021A48B79|nr:restriction endonuclease subunit S [Lactococcus lactis]MCT3109346.1 restriction endonuclease subunit S [Lactococcus lactis]
MNKMTPSLRFNGFDEEWKNQNLGHILHEFSNKSKKENEFPVLSSTNNGMEIRNGRVSGSSNIGYKIISNGTLVLSPQNLWLGNININDIGEGVVSPSYKTFNIVNVKSEFIAPFLRTPKMLENYKNSSTQGASVVRRNLEIESFYQISLLLPRIEEQEKVGSFFKILDQLISLQEQKIALLREQKKGFLQKLFPKAGAKVPELRFAGFDGDWEERRLGSHSEILTGGTPKTSIRKYWEPRTVPWMSSGEVNKGRVNKTDNFISDEGLCNSSARWVKENSVLIALAGQGKTRGTVAINTIPITTNQSLAAIVPDESLYYEFIYQNLIKRYDELRMISSGDGTRGGLNKKIVSDIIVPFSNKDEQIKIGASFKKIDMLIMLHKHKMENLKEQKKGLLQMMFV